MCLDYTIDGTFLLMSTVLNSLSKSCDSFFFAVSLFFSSFHWLTSIENYNPETLHDNNQKSPLTNKFTMVPPLAENKPQILEEFAFFLNFKGKV